MSSPADMIGLADLKAWLDITSTNDDVLLAGLITEISRAVLAYLDRPSILPAMVSETFDGRGETAVLLRHWPVLAISSCAIGGHPILPAPPLGVGATTQAGYVLETAEPQPPGRMQRLSLRGWHFARGVQNVALSYTAGYQIVGEVTQLPATMPPMITAVQPYGVWASDGGVTYANGSAFVPVSGTPTVGQYAVSAGVYTFAAGDAGASVSLTTATCRPMSRSPAATGSPTATLTAAASASARNRLVVRKPRPSR